MKIYEPSKGARFSRKKAQEYGEFLEALFKQKHNLIEPEDVVEAARLEDSPLHDFFEWDDSIAAEQYRLYQARNLINHIEVVIIRHEQERRFKAFVNVEYRGRDNVYVPIKIVAKNHNLKQQVLTKALNEIMLWQQRYEDYQELDLIFGAIKETQTLISKSL